MNRLAHHTPSPNPPSSLLCATPPAAKPPQSSGMPLPPPHALGFKKGCGGWAHRRATAVCRWVYECDTSEPIANKNPKKDVRKGFWFLLNAARNGDRPSQTTLATWYAQGLAPLPAKSVALAVNWYALPGDHDALPSAIFEIDEGGPFADRAWARSVPFQMTCRQLRK